MDNPKEIHKSKIQKDKLHKNNYQKRAQKFSSASKDWRVEECQNKLSFNYKDLTQEERNKQEQELKEVKQQVQMEHFQKISNHNKYLDFYHHRNPKAGNELIWDYDIPLK